MNTPARLGKKQLPDNEVELWIINHTYILLPLAVIILFILFVMLIFAITGVSTTDSGVVYNHLKDVI